MKKISSFIFGLAIATVAATAAPCTIAVSTVNATTCSVAAAPVGGASVNGTYVVSAPITIGATYTETATTADASNPFGLGDATFVLTVNATLGAIEHVTLSSVAGWGVEVAYVAGGPATPISISQVGGVVSFNFNTLNAGQSETLVVYTNAPAYNGGGTSGIVDGSGGTATPFLQTAPEPVSMTLVGGGLAVLGLLRFRRKA